jgi:hypothetical protein
VVGGEVLGEEGGSSGEDEARAAGQGVEQPRDLDLEIG